MKRSKTSDLPKELQDTLRDFPKMVALKKKRGLAQIKFREKTFGPLVRELEKELEKAKKLRERECPSGQRREPTRLGKKRAPQPKSR